MNMILQISIVLPVYNEGESITKQIIELEKTIDYFHEILIIYDFDEDNTVPVVKKLQKKYKSLRLIKNNFGRGVINAVKTGFKNSRGNTVVVMPADLADNPQTINKMFQKLEQGFDIICATRYAKGGKKIGGNFLKTTLSKIAGLTTPIILGIPTTDISNGFKMYKKNVIRKIQIESDGGWEFAMEMVIKANELGFKIADVGSVWQDRTYGKSKFKFSRWLPKYIKWYLWGVYRRFA